MRKIRGFRLRKRFLLFAKWVGRKIRPRARYQRLMEDPPTKPTPTSRILHWSRQLRNRARSLRFPKPAASGYGPVGVEPVQENLESVPKGHLAVYVGKNEGCFSRVLVPVLYFKHRLFIELLREAEEVYGFEHEGGITLPCGYSEFERIRTRIKACRSWRRRSSGSCCSSVAVDVKSFPT